MYEKVHVGALSRSVGWLHVAFATADYDLTVGLWGCALSCVGPRECYPNVGSYSVAMSLLRNMSIFDY